MATVNAVNRPRGQTRGGVAAVLRYTMQDTKTEYEGRHLVSGINCIPECCCTEFISTKLRYGKCDGKMYYHFVQSFSPEENITPDKAHEIALRFANEQWHGYECIVATHTDAHHIHSHIIVNSVSFENGMKYHCGKETLTRLRNASDDLCRENGLSVCKPNPDAVKGYSQAEYHSTLRNESWKFRLIKNIDSTMKYAVSKEQFIEFMESEGYSVKWTDSRKNITYTNKDGHACRDYRLHEKKYLKENMEYEFGIRKEIITGAAQGGHEVKSDESIGYADRNLSDGQKLAGTDAGNSDDGRYCHGDKRNGKSSDYAGADGREVITAADGASGRTGGGVETDEGTDGRYKHLHFGEPGYGKPSDGEFDNKYFEADGRIDEGNITTGWEPEREILFSYLGSGAESDEVHEAESLDIADTDSSNSDFRIDTLLSAERMMMLFGDNFNSLTPEEKRRRIEEKRSADKTRAFCEICDLVIKRLNEGSDSDYEEDNDDDIDEGGYPHLSM